MPVFLVFLLMPGVSEILARNYFIINLRFLHYAKELFHACIQKFQQA
jgi:hypothetical protein